MNETHMDGKAGQEQNRERERGKEMKSSRASWLLYSYSYGMYGGQVQWIALCGRGAYQIWCRQISASRKQSSLASLS